MEIIERPLYTPHITSLLDKGMMLVLTGQRRVGKSCMLKSIKQYLEENRTGANIVLINKEFAEFDFIHNHQDLYKYATDNLPKGQRGYLLIDEVQDIEGFEKALRSLQAEERCQIVVTGSNAKMLSSELTTLLSGRYVEIPIHSLCYKEFLCFHGLEDSDQSMSRYLTYGGLPGLKRIGIESPEIVNDYLQSVYDTIMLRDIVAREQIRNIPFLENLIAFIADNVGRLVSVNSISNYMKSQKQDVSASVISNYIRFMANAHIISGVNRYDIHGRRLFELIGKYYFEDLGLRNLLCGFNIRGSIERVVENAVWLHLVSHGYKVTVGVLRSGEIDFVAVKGARTVYIQATYLLASDETIAREFGNLKKIKDNHPKIVVSLDPIGGELPEYPGIQHLNLRQFLLKEEL